MSSLIHANKLRRNTNENVSWKRERDVINSRSEQEYVLDAVDYENQRHEQPERSSFTVTTIIPGGASLIVQATNGNHSRSAKIVKQLGVLESDASAQLPILRYRYTIDNIKILVAKHWLLHSVKEQSMLLETGEFPKLYIHSSQKKRSASNESAQQLCFDLPLNLEVVHCKACAKQLKLQKPRSDRKDSKLRLYLRFPRVQDALEWKRLITNVLETAKWLQQLEPCYKLYKHSLQSKVWSVTNTETKQRHVIKLLNDHRLQYILSPGRRARKVHPGLGNEITILQRLYSIAKDHTQMSAFRAIVEYQVIETKHDLCLLMPHYIGLNLAEYVKQKRTRNGALCDLRLDEVEAAAIMGNLLRFVRILHDAKIVHCDIKLENIIVDSDEGSVGLLDFGAAVDSTRAWDGQSRDYVVGTPGYIAPERLASTSIRPLPSSDIFSLGIVLFQLLAGTHPYNCAKLRIDTSVTLNWDKAVLHLNRHKISNVAQNLIEKMLALDPKERITMNEMERHPWFLSHGRIH